MDISTYSDWYSHWHSVGLLGEDSGCLFGDELDLLLGYGFEGTKVVDNGVDLDLVTHF